MWISSTKTLAPALLLAFWSAVPHAQDASVVIEQVRKAVGGTTPPLVTITAAGSGYRGAAREHFRIEPHTVTLDATKDASVAWTSPYGFLAAASARGATLTTEKVLGTDYRVLTVSLTDGRLVRGYVNDQNVFERTRIELQDPARGKVPFEVVFMSWVDFNGLNYPSLIVHKENGEVSRILVVNRVQEGAVNSQTRTCGGTDCSAGATPVDSQPAALAR